jgi:hypothetical protein
MEEAENELYEYYARAVMKAEQSILRKFSNLQMTRAREQARREQLKQSHSRHE